MEQRTAVRRASWAVLAVLAVGALGTALAVVLRDELVEAWSVGHPVDSAIQPPAFVPVAVVLFVTFAALVLVLLALLRSGQTWARHCLAALLVFVAVGTLATLRTSPPPLFVGVSVLSLVVDAVAVFFLWHPATGAGVRRHHPSAASSPGTTSRST